MKVRKCDICKKEFKPAETVQIIAIKQYVESDEVPEKSNPYMVTKDACAECAELNDWAWSTDENIKAMFDSIKLRKTRLEKHKKPSQ